MSEHRPVPPAPCLTAAQRRAIRVGRLALRLGYTCTIEELEEYDWAHA